MPLRLIPKVMVLEHRLPTGRLSDEKCFLAAGENNCAFLEAEGAAT